MSRRGSAIDLLLLLSDSIFRAALILLAPGADVPPGLNVCSFCVFIKIQSRVAVELLLLDQTCHGLA